MMARDTGPRIEFSGWHIIEPLDEADKKRGTQITTPARLHGEQFNVSYSHPAYLVRISENTPGGVLNSARVGIHYEVMYTRNSNGLEEELKITNGTWVEGPVELPIGNTTEQLPHENLAAAELALQALHNRAQALRA
jgi:hypothetical protein